MWGKNWICEGKSDIKEKNVNLEFFLNLGKTFRNIDTIWKFGIMDKIWKFGKSLEILKKKIGEQTLKFEKKI